MVAAGASGARRGARSRRQCASQRRRDDAPEKQKTCANNEIFDGHFLALAAALSARGGR
jgi:hypothetical protein